MARIWSCLALVVALSGVCKTVLSEESPISGIGPVGEIRLIQGGFRFTEGPAADDQGNLYFTDIPNNRIHKLDAQGKISVFAEPSNHANGLMFVRSKGQLYACEMDGQLVAHSPLNGKRQVLAGLYKGKRFNAPNDLVIDRVGGVYFTDPSYRSPQPLPQGKLAVYYLTADGEVSRLIDDLPNPNGVILSPDEKTLYVVPSGQAEMMAYPVQSPGQLGPGKVFCRLKQPPGQSGRGGDGLTIDTQGNLYITSSVGLQVFSPAGKHLGIITFPQQPANVTFGGRQNHTLYVTARKGLYSVKMQTTGHVFPGKATETQQSP